MRTYTQSRAALVALAALLAPSVFAGEEGTKTSQTADAIEIVRGDWSKSPNEIVLKEGSIKPNIPKHNCDYLDPVWSQAFFSGVSGNDVKLAFRMRIDECHKISIPYAPDSWGRRNYPYLHQFSSAVYVGYENELNYWQILFSPRFNEIAIFNPSTGIVRAVPADLPSGKALPVEIVVNPMRIVIRLDGKTMIDFVPAHGKINSGKAGFGGFGAAVGFSDIRLDTPGKLASVPVSAHHPEFRLRDWLGDPWVFDHDEPVAKVIPGVMQDDGFDKYANVEFTQVKLRPGAPPLVPVNIKWTVKGNDVAANSSLEATNVSDGVFRVKLNCTDDAKTVTVKTLADFHYAPEHNSYTIDIDQRLEQAANSPALGQVVSGSFWAYNVVGPTSSRALAGWRREYGVSFSQTTNGQVNYQPLNHTWLMVEGSRKFLPPPVTIPAGLLTSFSKVGYLGENGSPVKEILTGGDHPGGYCQWIYDFTGPYLSQTAPTNALSLRYRIRLLTAEEEKALREHNPLDQQKENMEVALFEPSGTSFGVECWKRLSNSFDREAFIPPQQYVHDTTTGRHDRHSLLLKPESRVTIGVNGGAAFFGEIWTDADKLMAEVWVKTEEIDGQGVRMVVKDVTNKKTYESSFVNRASEWQRLSIPLPSNIKLFHLQIEKDGKGKAWLDDIAIHSAQD